MKYLTAQGQAQVLVELKPFLRQATAGLAPPGVRKLYDALNRRDNFFSTELQTEINRNRGDLGLIDYLGQHASISSQLSYTGIRD